MSCPICESKSSRPYLELNNFPVYQHPVVDISTVKGPYSVDLTYVVCTECDHSYQPNYNEDILESIYENYYYTPRDSSIGTEIRNEFLKATASLFSELNKQSSILEVGCSSGETLESLRKKFGFESLYAIEPNLETGEKAREKGVEVYRGFFNKEFSGFDGQEKYDIVFHRHVIEHVFDFDDFFSTTNKFVHEKSKLVIETPCLDEAIKSRSIAPFHIEHVHVFSLHSLSILVEKYDWFLNEYVTNDYGNMILTFSKEPKDSIVAPSLSGNIDGNQDYVSTLRETLNNKIGERDVVLWGAGSGGRNIVSILDLKPEYIIDSNVNKVGRHFPGLNTTNIITPEQFKGTSPFRDQDESVCILIASTYYQEISKTLDELGWKGEVVSAYI